MLCSILVSSNFFCERKLFLKKGFCLQALAVFLNISSQRPTKLNQVNQASSLSCNESGFKVNYNIIPAHQIPPRASVCQSAVCTIKVVKWVLATAKEGLEMRAGLWVGMQLEQYCNLSVLVLSNQKLHDNALDIKAPTGRWLRSQSSLMPEQCPCPGVGASHLNGLLQICPCYLAMCLLAKPTIIPSRGSVSLF